MELIIDTLGQVAMNRICIKALVVKERLIRSNHYKSMIILSSCQCGTRGLVCLAKKFRKRMYEYIPIYVGVCVVIV